MAYLQRLILLVLLIQECSCDQISTFQVFILKSSCVTAFTAVDNDDRLLFVAVIKRDNLLVQPGSFFSVDSFETHKGNLLKFSMGSVPPKCTGYSPPDMENQNSDGSCANVGTLLFIYLNVQAETIKGLGPITGTWVTTNSESHETKLNSTIDKLPFILASDIYVLTVEGRVVPDDEEIIYFRMYNVMDISMCVENYSGKNATMYLGDQVLSINKDINCANFSMRAGPDISGTQLFVYFQELLGGCLRRRERKLILMPAYSRTPSTSKGYSVTYRSTDTIFLVCVVMFLLPC